MYYAGEGNRSLVIGICGGTGSGKTTLAHRLCESLNGRAMLLNMDCYYKNNPDKPFSERVNINYDHPDAFDVELFIDQIRDLKKGKSIVHPTYDFARHLRSDVWVECESKEIIIIEGILLFAVPEIVNELDIRIFVDTDADIRILRRILRDVNERGRSIESVVEQYITTVKPMHERFIEPSKHFADIIIPEGGKNDVAFSMLLDAILQKLK